MIRNIIYELVQCCASRGLDVSETLATFVIKAVVLDPRNGFNADRTLTAEDVEKLTEVCLQKLTEKCSPFLDTVKMQIYFDQNYTTRREFVSDIHGMLESTLNPVSRDITDSRVKTRDEIDALYRKIIHYILLRSGMGSATDTNTLHETTAALESVFPHSELGSFMALVKRDKEQQLRDLKMLVTGVRLFNRASRTKDEKEDLIPEELQDILSECSLCVEQELEQCERLMWRYMSALESLTDPGTAAEESGVSVELLRQALYNVRQHQVFLNMLLADVKASVQRVDHLQRELMTQLEHLKVRVQSKTAVPTAHVFPIFRSLSHGWSSLQDEAELLHIFKNIVLSLCPFTAAQAQVFSEQSLDGLLQGAVKSDADRMSSSAEQRIDPAEILGPDCSWLLPENTSHLDAVNLQFSGFCGHALVRKDGLLLPGNPQIGVLKYKEKFYVFSSREGALQFASDPERFISEVAERAKRSPELIQLLRLHRQFSCVTPYAELQSGESFLVRPITHSDGGTQTDTHPVESHIDRAYEWNEWALRRKALQLADIRRKQTHSTQTLQSYLRRESSSQTYPPRDAAGQTTRDKETSVPRPLVYLYGLRGQREGRMLTVDLTRPVDE